MEHSASAGAAASAVREGVLGRGAIRSYLPLDVQLPNDFFAQSVIVAKDVAARERLCTKIEKALAEQFPTLVARVSALELGPPVGWPVQYRVSGPDLGRVRDVAFQLAQSVASNPDVVNVNFDWIEPARVPRRSRGVSWTAPATAGCHLGSLGGAMNAPALADG